MFSQKIYTSIHWIRQKPLHIKILLLVFVFSFVLFLVAQHFLSAKQKIMYQTEKAQKGTLIITVTGSGQVSTANNGTVSTLATGVVTKLYVKDGDVVKAGDKIAELDLDLQGQQNANQALANYQSAKNNLDTAKANLYSLQATMFTNWDTFMKIAQNGTYQNEDGTPNYNNRSLPEFHIANDNWLAAEAKYKTQEQVINQAQIALNAAWRSYQQTSSVIYAPISGTVSGFSLQEGSVIVANTNTTNSAQSATKIATIKTKALPMVSINFSEIDIPKIKLGDKAVVTFDAFSDKTFTGKVVSIDTAGSVSSGVTSYPTHIRLDTESDTILPNMAASANIIIDTKDDVLLVSNTAIKSQNDGRTYVVVLKNNKPSPVFVETGLSSDTQTEIISGLAQGDEVVINTITPATNNTKSTSSRSVFGSFGTGGMRIPR